MRILFIELHPDVLLIGVLIIFLVLAFEWRQGRSFAYLFSLFLFCGYLLVILNSMFLPIRLPEGWPKNISVQQELWVLSRVNLIPFNYGDLFKGSQIIVYRELIGNVLFTIPIGLGIPFLTCFPTKKVLWIGLITGFIFEATQFMILVLGLISSNHGHSVDISDILLNAAGFFLGYGFFQLLLKLSFFQRFHKNSTRFLKPTGWQPRQG